MIYHPLGARLWAILSEAHEALGTGVDAGERDGFEYHAVGDGGVVAFKNHYMLCGWPEGPGATRCMAEALKVLGERLKQGPIYALVYWRNFRCIKIVRRVGFKPLATDNRDGYLVYELKPENFRYG